MTLPAELLNPAVFTREELLELGDLSLMVDRNARGELKIFINSYETPEVSLNGSDVLKLIEALQLWLARREGTG